MAPSKTESKKGNPQLEWLFTDMLAAREAERAKRRELAELPPAERAEKAIREALARVSEEGS